MDIENWKELEGKLSFVRIITTEICHQSGCQSSSRGRAYDGATATIEIPVFFFVLQITHKVYLSLVRRLEGHSSQSISGSIRRKKQEVSDQQFGSQPSAVIACVLNKNVVSWQTRNNRKLLKHKLSQNAKNLQCLLKFGLIEDNVTVFQWSWNSEFG